MNRLNRIFRFSILLCIITFAAQITKAQANVNAINTKVNALVKKMTLEEKVG